MTKYSKDKINEICMYVARGATNADACLLTDISEKTFYEWKQTKSEFCEALKKAAAQGKQTHIDAITFEKSWQAHAWWLERKHPEEFRPPKQRSESEVTHKKYEDGAVAKFLKKHPEVTDSIIDGLEEAVGK